MMKYPRLKCEDKQNTKVCSITLQKMKEMRKEGHTYNEIADKFKVAQRTAWLHTAPTKLVSRSKNKRAQASRLEHAEKYANNPKYRKKLIQSSAALSRKRYQENSQYRKYTLEQQLKFRKRLWKKHSNWSHLCAIGRHITSNFKLKKCKGMEGNCKCPCHKR